MNKIKLTESEFKGLIKNTVSKILTEKRLGKNFDAWADIESGGDYSNAIEKNKERIKQGLNNVDNSHVPEYYFAYGSNGPTRNIHGYTQNQIDADYTHSKNHMLGRSGIDEEDIVK